MKKGLFIGGTHIDILADTRLEYTEDTGIDLPGEFTIAVGGTMFNVCTNLNFLGVNCTLISACKKNSLFTYIIEHVLKSLKINYRLIYPEQDRESAFLALREGGELIYAITASAWDNVKKEEFMENIENVIKGNYDFVVIDGNVPPEFSKIIIEFFYNIPVYLCATSSIKLNRFLMLNQSEKRLDAVFMNKMEYDTTTRIFSNFMHENTMYFVTKGANGVDVYKNGKILHFPAPEITDAQSFSGTGDAFAAGVIYGLLNEYRLEEAVNKGFSQVKEKIKYSHANIVPFEFVKIEQNFAIDKLTEVNSRNSFEEEKYLLKDYGYVFLIDIDNFKMINDTYGHDYGDIVLKNVAKTIKSSIRKDDKLYRYGGEEFILFLKNSDKQIAEIVAERIRTKTIENCEVTVTIGIAPVIHDIDLSVKNADKALYIGKMQGKNTKVFAD